MNVKENIIFVLLVMLLYLLSVNLVSKIIEKGQNPHVVNFVSSIVFTFLLIFLIFRFMDSKKRVKDSYQLLEISPSKKCIGGPYMWGDVNSPTYKYCSDPKNQQAIKDVSCCLGFVGMPVKYNYTPESDSQWKIPDVIHMGLGMLTESDHNFKWS